MVKPATFYLLALMLMCGGLFAAKEQRLPLASGPLMPEIKAVHLDAPRTQLTASTADGVFTF